jgi:hypothetical protein
VISIPLLLLLKPIKNKIAQPAMVADH